MPELRAKMLGEFMGNVDLVAGMVARRLGRSPDDVAARAFSGEFLGVLGGEFLIAEDFGVLD